jgi:hypothetical protein
LSARDNELKARSKLYDKNFAHGFRPGGGNEL